MAVVTSESHVNVIRKYVIERVGIAQDRKSTLRANRLAGGLARELEPLTHAYNAVTREQPPVPIVLGIQEGGIVLVHAELDDDGAGQNDRIESVWLGPLKVTLRRVRTPESDREDAHVAAIAVEHEKLPGGGLDFEVTPYRQADADKTFEALRHLLGSDGAG
jgi:hypothetical protein